MIEGTVFYKISLKAAIDAYKDDNVIMYQALQDYGWTAINISTYLIGSDIVDNILYLCVTDGVDIEVGDDFASSGLLDPEDALASVGPESLSEYVEIPDTSEILKHLTPYDLDDSVIDLDRIAEQLLSHGYTLEEIVKDAVDARLLEIE